MLDVMKINLTKGLDKAYLGALIFQNIQNLKNIFGKAKDLIIKLVFRISFLYLKIRMIT